MLSHRDSSSENGRSSFIIKTPKLGHTIYNALFTRPGLSLAHRLYEVLPVLKRT